MALRPGRGKNNPVSGGLQRLLDLVDSHLPNADHERIKKAYDYADAAHAHQTRSSGDPYIEHPLEVACILAELHMDEDTIVAALLHDVLEDTEATSEELKELFGEQVLLLVEGVTKLKINIDPAASERQRARAESTRAAESLRKMLLAVAQDVRVMVIKLADRLHNMRTLEALPPSSQTRIATETLDVYAPLAARLGIWQIKWQLEDLSFKVLHPEEFQSITDQVSKTRVQRESEVKEATELLRSRLDKMGLGHALLMGRPKHLYSIFNKIVKQGVPFEQVYDLLALRVIVKEPSECYMVLGLVHELWLPMPGLFYDYIAMPSRMAISRCTPRSSALVETRWRSRYAPRRCTKLRSTELQHTGHIRKGLRRKQVKTRLSSFVSSCLTGLMTVQPAATF